MYVVLLMTVFWCTEALPLRMCDIIFHLLSIKRSFISIKLNQFKMLNCYIFFLLHSKIKTKRIKCHYNNLFTFTAVTSMLPIVLFPTLGILVRVEFFLLLFLFNNIPKPNVIKLVRMVYFYSNNNNRSIDLNEIDVYFIGN